MFIKYKASWDSKYINFLNDYDVNLTKVNNLYIVEFTNRILNYERIIDFAVRHNFCLTNEAIFSDEEIVNAEWLAIGETWTDMYPQPNEKFGYLERTYDLSEYCTGEEPKFYCRLGLSQKNNFCVIKEPRWASRNIMRLNWVMEELFVSLSCKEKLQESALKGFHFEDVYRKNLIAKDIFQIKIETTLPSCLKSENFEQVYTCPVCGRSKYLLKSGFIRVDESVFENITCDIAKTKEKAGQIFADSLIIISKKFYNFLKAEKLLKGMKFIPLFLE